MQMAPVSSITESCVADDELGIVEHCARVSVIADWLGRRMGISEADAYVLQTAARLVADHRRRPSVVPEHAGAVAQLVAGDAQAADGHAAGQRAQLRVAREAAGILVVARAMVAID